MTGRAPFFQKDTTSKLNLLLGWPPKLGNAREQGGIGELGGDVLRDLVEIFIRPAVARHPSVRQVALRVAKPREEPIGVDLAANFGQLRTNIAANQLRFPGAGDRQRVACGAKHLPETGLSLRD